MKHWKTLLKEGGWKPSPFDHGPAYRRGRELISWDWERVGWVLASPQKPPLFFKRITTALINA